MLVDGTTGTMMNELMTSTFFNPFVMYGKGHFLHQYYQTLQIMAAGGGSQTLLYAVNILLSTRIVALFCFMFPFFPQWGRVVLADYTMMLDLPSGFTMVFFLVLSQTLYCNKLLYKTCLGNDFCEKPYDVICLKNVNSFVSKYHKQKLVLNLINKRYKFVFSFILMAQFVSSMSFQYNLFKEIPNKFVLFQ